MGTRPMYLGHVNLYVRDVERARKWYEDLLGLHTYTHRPGRAVFMSADMEQSHEVALMQLGPEAPLQPRGQVGLNHMAWRFATLDDLQAVYADIQARGLDYAVVDHGISLGIYLRDPDGNGVEVYYELPRAEWPEAKDTFAAAEVGRGRFPGPWEADLAAGGRASKPAAAE
jgi:catechol 2,3-dioxygenase